MRYRESFFVGMFIMGLLASAASPVFASTFTTIDLPGATDTLAIGINARGQIVGLYVAGGTHGFLLDKGNFTTIDVPGAEATEAFGINARGQIVGVYSAGGIGHGFVLH